MHNSYLKQIISSLPDTPGIYKYFDKEGTLIYIGKAKKLKKRVSSYFTKKHDDSRKTAMLVARITDIQFTLVDTETDALLLENALIKKFQPKFNINLKDDKTYPFICIKNEAFPRVFSTRNPVRDGSEYFGPYANGTMMFTILDLVKQLFATRTCNLNLTDDNIKAFKFKTCLEYQIGNCKAPCVGYQSANDYAETIQEIKSILRGNIGEVTQLLKKEMLTAANELRFEVAADYKKRLDALENYQSKSTIVSHTITNVDVFSIVTDERFAFVNYLKVANGIIIQTQTVELKKKLDETPEELLEFAIAQIRERFKSTSREIIVPFEVEFEMENIQFTIPKAGDKKKLLDLSLKNAAFYKRDKINQYEKLNPEIKTDRLLTQMMNDLRLKTLPRHIECFDNSNIQGTNPVSACVVFKDGKASKKDYRHFIPQTVIGPDDFATMREVVFRRYKRLQEEQQPLPDLIVIDGGKGQLSSAVESLKKLGIYGQVPVIGIAKRLEELYYPEDEFPLYLDKKSETLKVIQQLRDEAHRFGITHHRKRRSKNTFVTELDSIEGIGPKTSKQLLTEFKSVKKIKEVTLDELASIVGQKKANQIFTYFYDKK
jgi:excinuclease ABC subunit C